MKVAILASGNGTNFEELAKQFQHQQLPGELTLLFCNHPTAKVMKRAARFHIPGFSWTVKEAGGKQAYEQRLLQLLKDHGIEFIVLAGYLRVVGPTLLNEYEGRIVNLHPAWLPEYPGLHSIERAYYDHRRQTGVTVHFIDAGLDSGPIIMQERVPIYPTDRLEDLETRVHQTEHRLYPQAIKKVLTELEKKRSR